MTTTIRAWINKFDWRVWAALAISAAFLGLLVVSYSSYQSEAIKDDIAARSDKRDQQLEIQNKRLDTSEQDVQNLKSALSAQILQFNKCRTKSSKDPGCITPVAPTPTEIIQGPQGEPGPGPTAAALLIASRQAILEFCANDRCKGKSGDTPSESLLLSMIEQVHGAYCAAHNDCRGADGITYPPPKDGKDGTNGTNGAPGPACPDGYTPEATTVVTAEGPVDTILCRAAPPPSEEENP